jgi:hypothetical protein
MTAEERFWKYVDIDITTGCFNWIGYKNKCGYGSFGYNKKIKLANRVSWQIHYGYKPEDICVLHKCDNPGCVNPDHLWLGTHQENMDDRDNKGRQYDRNGEKNGRAKLTIEDVVTIRSLYNNTNTSERKLAKEFNVNSGTIHNILNNKTWVDQ